MKTRIHYLDGLRGWAALFVLLFHVFWEMFGVKFPEFRSPGYSIFLNGPLSVYVFFILSGDALTSPYVSTGDVETIRSISFKRYLRLTIPIALSCLLCYVVLKAGLNSNVEAARILQREDWLGGFATFNASLIDVFSYAAYGVYFDHVSALSYNPFLWTMSIEMLGSLLILIFALQVGRLKNPALAALFVGVMFFLAKSYYSLFFFGAFFSIIRANGFFERNDSKGFKIISWLIIIMVVMSCLYSGSVTVDGARTRIIKAALLVFAVHGNRSLIAALESKTSKFLGEISFSLYLVHFSVLISFASFCTVYLYDMAALNSKTAFFVGVMVVLFCIVLARIFSRIEAISIGYANIGLGRLLR